jgi:NADH dehydrogenase [ubiquinone] 1 alpha subcomplex assembly factor 7
MLNDLIRAHIKTHGFMRVDEYMQLCLLHPEHGYYTNRTVFGADGNFTTAPEISQLFGEMLGIWAVLQWQYLGTPSQIHVIEMGPGRGTLMRDFIRATAHVAPFAKAMQIHMIEASPQLQNKQRQTLKHTHHAITWHDTWDTIPFDQPVIILANEFFDAMPIRQYIVRDGAWRERVIALMDDALAWGDTDIVEPITLLPDPASCAEGAIFETFPQSEDIFAACCDHIRMTKGVMAVIDYGDFITPRIGDTLQALHKHQKTSVLDHAGHSDLTAHVDFKRLAQIAQDKELQTDFMTQRQFLKDCGIDIRFDALLRGLNDDTEKRDILRSGYERLINPYYMGDLFKVLTVKTA